MGEEIKVDDIKKPENPSESDLDANSTSDLRYHSQVDQPNKYGSDFHSNVRIDLKPTTRLDATPPVTKKPGFDGPALVVLQWLSYALWGGTVIAMSVLVASVLSFYIIGNSIGDTVLYGLAAVVVLLPLSLICDVLYLKHEPESRTRSSSVVMTVHAVLFALLGIGSLITVAFSVVSLMVSSSGHEAIMVTLYSSLIITALFIMLFFRTILPKKYAKIRYLFMTIMIIAVALICVYGVIGPIADAQLTRNDKLIETNLPTVSEAVSTYASDKNQLPTTLDNLTLTGDAKKLVTDKLVTYKKDSGFNYQLCVTYKKASTDQYATPTPVSSSNSSSSLSSASPMVSTSGDYSYYVTTIPHPAGDKCYKLMTYGHDVIPMTNSGY